MMYETSADAYAAAYEKELPEGLKAALSRIASKTTTDTDMLALAEEGLRLAFINGVEMARPGEPRELALEAWACSTTRSTFEQMKPLFLWTLQQPKKGENANE